MIKLPEKELLRPDEVADFFSVSKQTIYLWLNAGNLTAIKPAPNVVRITRESIKVLASKIRPSVEIL